MGVEVSVEWSTRATKDLDRIYDFLVERWTVREAEAMLDIVQEFEGMVCRHPMAFKDSLTFPDCRIAILHRNLTAVYSYDGITVHIITLFDNRMDDGYR